MPGPFYTEASSDVFTEADWQEFLDQNSLTQPGGGWSFTRKDGTARLQGTIPANKTRSAIQFFNGLAWADVGSPYQLHRTVPPRHPKFPWMRPDRIDGVGYNPMGTNYTAPDGTTSIRPKKTGLIPSEPLSRYLHYTQELVTVHFAPHNYGFFTDAQMDGRVEYFRNCEVFTEITPTLELLLADTAKYIKFLEGVDETGASLVNTQFPGQVAERLEKIDMVMGWYDVPWHYVANPFVPNKIKDRIGTVNENDPWLGPGGFPKGTLLLDGVRVRKSQQQAWIPTDSSPATLFLPFTVDLFFCFKFFDPPRGTGSATTFRGWNLFPWARSGKWWSAARNGNAATPYIRFTDFDKLFEHVLKP